MSKGMPSYSSRQVHPGARHGCNNSGIILEWHAPMCEAASPALLWRICMTRELNVRVCMTRELNVGVCARTSFTE